MAPSRYGENIDLACWQSITCFRPPWMSRARPAPSGEDLEPRASRMFPDASSMRTFRALISISPCPTKLAESPQFIRMTILRYRAGSQSCGTVQKPPLARVQPYCEPLRELHVQRETRLRQLACP